MKQGHSVVIGNEYLELRMERQGSQMMTTALINHMSGRTLTVSEDDFGLNIEGHPPLRAQDFALVNVREEAIPGGRRAILDLVEKAGSSKLSVIYELLDKEFFIRRWLEFVPAGPVPLREVEVWRVAVEGSCPIQEDGPPFYLTGNVWDVDGRKGFGLPLFLEDTFWGLECPTGYNRYEGGLVSLMHFPGRTVIDRFVSKVAVLGVARPHQVPQQFRRYVDTFQASPPERLTIGYNSWTSLMPPTEENCLETIDLIRRKLFEPYGVALDFFALDDGWDVKESLWQIRETNFPRGFDPLQESLQGMKTRLGLWMSPSTGYDHAKWCVGQGYTGNASFDWFLCQSDPNYRRDMAKVVSDLHQRCNIGFFKLDGFMACCDTFDHPHHLPGDFAREANADAAEELFKALRRAGHPVHLNPTSGMWLSPWWLRTADTLYADTYDGEAPTVAPAPEFREGATTTRDAQYRLRCSQNPWFPSSAIETLDIYQPNAALGYNDVMATVARGQRLLNIYADIRRFTDTDWQFLAASFQWARHNAATLSRTVFLPGDPLKREPYGLAHFNGVQGILSLRNPFILPRKVQVKLDESSGWYPEEAPRGDAATEYVARIVYPYQETLGPALEYGDVLEVELQGYEQRIVQIEPMNASVPYLLGARAREICRTGNRMEWEVFGAPGESQDCVLRAKETPVQVLIDGREVKGCSAQASGIRIPLRFSGEKAHSKATALTLRRGEDPGTLSGRCRLNLSKEARASLVILCCARSDRVSAVQCAVEATQGALEVRAFSPEHHPPHKLLYREFERQYWKWFQIELGGGENDLRVILNDAEDVDFEEGKPSCYLWVKTPLRKSIVTAVFAEDLPVVQSEPLPVPSGMDVQVLTLVL